jgi:hypothetical protein
MPEGMLGVYLVARRDIMGNLVEDSFGENEMEWSGEMIHT